MCNFYYILLAHRCSHYCIGSYYCFYTHFKIPYVFPHAFSIFTLHFLLILLQNNAVWLLLSLSHLHCLFLLVAAVPGDQSAVFASRQQRAIPQHAQSKDAALVSSQDDMADAISACVTEMG